MDSFADNLQLIRECHELKKASVGKELGSYLNRFADFFSELNFKPIALKDSAINRHYMDR